VLQEEIPVRLNSRRLVRFASPKDLVDYVRDRRICVDHDTVLRNVFSRLMQSRNELPFRFPPAPLIFRSLVKPPVQGVEVDLEDENAVKQLNEVCKVPRTPAEECYRRIIAGDQGFYSIHMPNVVLVRAALNRITSFGIALISQFSVTIDGMVAASLQFLTDCSLASARNAINQIVPDAHCWIITNLR